MDLQGKNPGGIHNSICMVRSVKRVTVAEALSDLDYKVLRMDIRRLEDKMARLTVRIAGTATRGDVSAPVDVTVNINGELEQIINTGLGLSAKMKGLQQ